MSIQWMFIVRSLSTQRDDRKTRFCLKMLLAIIEESVRRSIILYVRRNFGMKTRYGIGTMYTMERSFSGAICVFCIHFQPYLQRNSLNKRMYHNFNCL